MHDVVAGGRCGVVDQMRMQRWLAIVEVPLGHNADEIVSIQINRIGVRRQDIFPEPAHDRPRTVPEKVLTGYRAEGGIKTRIVDACGRQNLPGVGRADDAEFALPVHRCFRPAPA